MSFKDLDIRSKAEIIRVGVRNGMTRIPEIEKAYNEFANGGHLFEGTAEPNQQMTSWLPSFATNPQEQNVSPKFQQLVNEMVQVGQQRAYQRAEGKKIEALAHNTNEMLPIQLASQGKLDEARIAGQNLGLQTMGNVADVATDFMPVIGDAKDVIRIGTDIAKGDYTNATLTAGLMALPGSASAIKRILPRNFSTKLAYKALKNSNDFNDSYQFIRGTKPAYWGSDKNPKYAKTVASSLGIDVDVLPTSTNPILLNKPLSKQVIKDYEPIFRNRLGLNDGVDIYEYIKQNPMVMSGLEKGSNQDLVGLLLGYGDDALMFESVRKTLGANTPTISGFNALTPTQLQQVAKGIETTYKGIDFPKIQVISEKLKRGDYTAQSTKTGGQHIGFTVTPEKRIELLLGNYLDEKRIAHRNSVTESLKDFAESNTLAGESKEMYDMLVSNGVDVSKLKSVDLTYLRRIRQQQLAEQMPTRYINDNTYDPLSQIMTLYEPGNTSAIGKLEYAPVNSQHKGFNWKYGIQPTMIENLTEGTNNIRKGVSVDLYDAAIAKSKNLGYDGVISGALLLSPETTTHIWEKYYPTRELLSNRGVHKYKAGDLKNQPIVMLNTPSREVLPTKSFVFNPSIIDDNGFMHIQPNGGIYFSTGGPMYPFSFGQLPEVRY